MKYLVTLLVGFLLICAIIIYSSRSLNTRAAKEADGADIRLCVRHLREIEAAIANQQLQDTNIDLLGAVAQAAKKEGNSIFLCPTSTNEWVKINPDPYKWKHGNEFTNEISLYYSCATNVYVARNFGGDDVVLSNRPTWTPVTVGETEKRK